MKTHSFILNFPTKKKDMLLIISILLKSITFLFCSFFQIIFCKNKTIKFYSKNLNLFFYQWLIWICFLKQKFSSYSSNEFASSALLKTGSLLIAGWQAIKWYNSQISHNSRLSNSIFISVRHSLGHHQIDMQFLFTDIWMIGIMEIACEEIRCKRKEFDLFSSF